MHQKSKKIGLVLLVALLAVSFFPFDSLAAEAELPIEPDIVKSFVWIALILILAKVSALIEKWGQPSVLGELVVGVILGNAFLLGIPFFEPIKSDIILKFLAEFGAVILLFQIGLESNIEEMRKVGIKATLVACVGVAADFLLGTFIIGPVLLPGLAFNSYLFLGAAITATSVGISARVFKDLKKVHTREAQIVLGAAVIDDVLGLMILAIVTAIATLGGVSLGAISVITAKAIIFLVGAIVLGKILAPKFSQLFAKVQAGVGMKFTLALSFCLVFAYFAKKAGLAPLVGAFAAGLILDPVSFHYFKDPKIVRDIKKSIEGADKKVRRRVLDAIRPHAKRDIEHLIEPIGLFAVPIFFVITGMNVNLEAMLNPKTILLALGLTVAAVTGKLIAGLMAGKVNKLIVGLGMIPRGEVGLIFAITGKNIGVINDQVFSAIVVMVILTTLLTPPILSILIKKRKI